MLAGMKIWLVFILKRSILIAMKIPNTFQKNPFSHSKEMILIPIPVPLETVEPRKPIRSFLTQTPANGLADLLAGLTPGKRPRPIEIIREVRPLEEP